MRMLNQACTDKRYKGFGPREASEMALRLVPSGVPSGMAKPLYLLPVHA